VEKETRNFIAVVGVFALVILGGYCALIVHTGFTLPFSSVVSESMQHDNERSEIGAIDTGDIVIVQDKSKADIQSYVLGSQTGHSSFGKYGSVIIYNRSSTQNPVIHRAILWIDYDESTSTWSSTELKNYDSTKWYCDTSENWSWSNLKGTLWLTVDEKEVSINLDSLQIKQSGYLTMGDNPVTNRSLDQAAGIINHPISMDEIRSVAIWEIPWLGMFKLEMNGNTHVSHVPNSLPSLAMEIIVIFSILILIDSFSVFRYLSSNKKKIEKMKEWKKG